MSERYKSQFNARGTATRTVTSATTVAITDQYIKCGGSSDYSMTLFAQSVLAHEAGFSLRLQNTGTAIVSVVPATNETVNGVNGYALNPGDDIHLRYERQKKNWVIAPRIRDIDQSNTCQPKIASTNGTTAVNVYGAGGAPRAMVVKDVIVTALDTIAGNILLKNGTNTVCTIAKGTSATVVVGSGTLSNTAIAKNAICTVESSTTGNARVKIWVEAVELPGLPGE
jgi:hypothetical protein